MRPLNSDGLGTLGETHFSKLCAEAGLFCNKASQDRTGWDFIVEFPFPPSTNGQPLDRRPQPPECRSQVKAIWHETNRVKLRLSSAERLAKILQPACIFVFAISNDLVVQSIHCIHIIDEALSHILKEVRKCEIEGLTRINKAKITIDYKKMGTKIDVSGASLKAFIASIAGEDRRIYIQKKDNQIANLGVIGNRYSGRFVLEAEDEQEIADIMLGIKKGKLKEFSSTETRWGISLPHIHTSPGADILITPMPRDAEITLRNKATRESLNLKVKVATTSFPLPRDANFSKVRMFNEFIEFIVEHRDSAFSLVVEGLNTMALPLDQHITLNKALRILSSGEGSIGFRNGKKWVDLGEFDNTSSTMEAGELSFGREILSQLRDIVDAAGGGELRLTASDVNSQIGAINFVHNLIAAPDSIGTISVKLKVTQEFPADLVQTEALLTSCLAFDGSAIAFCAIAAMGVSGDTSVKVLRISHIRAREVKIISQDIESFEDFEKDMRAETALGMTLRLDATGIRGRRRDSNSDGWVGVGATQLPGSDPTP